MFSGLGFPDHDCGFLAQGNEIPAIGGVRGCRRLFRRGVSHRQFFGQFGDPAAERVDLVFQFDDALDSGQVDTVLLGQPLHFAQQRDVPHGIAPATAGGAAGRDQALPVVGTQRLRMHPGQLRRDRDQVGRDFVVVVGRSAEHRTHLLFSSSVISGRGSCPVIASAYACSASRALPSRLAGIAASRVTSRSPCEPSRLVMPLPRTRSTRPLAVPGCTLRDTLPSSVGTVIVVPSASSVKSTGTVIVRSRLLRPNKWCGATCTRTYKSPACAPPRPGSPWPARRMRWSSLTPGGIRTVSVRVRVLTPSPPHSGQGSSMICPRPRQSRHGSENANAPWLRLTRPEPEQVGQIRGAVPGRAPLPPHVAQVAGLDSRSGRVAPLTASVKSIRTSVSTSAPRCGRFAVAPADARPRPKIPPRMSPSPPKPPCCPAAAPPKMSPMSKLPVPPPPGKLKPPPLPNSRPASSYPLRFAGSDSTPYASETALNFCSASVLPWLASGWFALASLR